MLCRFVFQFPSHLSSVLCSVRASLVAVRTFSFPWLWCSLCFGGFSSLWCSPRSTLPRVLETSAVFPALVTPRRVSCGGSVPVRVAGDGRAHAESHARCWRGVAAAAPARLLLRVPLRRRCVLSAALPGRCSAVRSGRAGSGTGPRGLEAAEISRSARSP